MSRKKLYEQKYFYGQKWIRIHDIAGKPKEAFVITRDPNDFLVRLSPVWPAEPGNSFTVHVQKLYKHWRAASKGVQGELFSEKKETLSDHWKNKHLK